MTDDELIALADQSFQQYFLVSPHKIQFLLDAAGIRETDHVVELGAGAGTIARRLPRCASLTLVELDQRLLGPLRTNAPSGAIVLQGDALEIISAVSFDVLIGSLPNFITEALIDMLPRLSFRTAVLAVGETTDLARLGSTFDVAEVATISADDFRPSQPTISRLVRITSTPAERR